MTFKIDLHTHSLYSGDTDAEPEEMVAVALQRGLHGMAFTEHYSFEASAPAERLREQHMGRLLILRGVEFSAAEGHCLIFGVNTDRLALKYLPVEEIIKIVSPLGGVVIPSHPYRRGNSLGDFVYKAEGICALEGFNGGNLHDFNARAVEAARELRLPYTGGSDAHRPDEVGACYTEFDDPVDSGNIVALLRAGRYRGVDTRKISRWRGFGG